MNNAKIEILSEMVESLFLPFVRRPGRYIGGEVNQIRKNPAECDLTVSLCFPDVYEVGMSHTGMAIIYDVLNGLEKVAAERVFSLWADAEQVLRGKNIPLFTLESKAAVKDFDVLGFSLTNELCYTNVLNILDLAGITLRSKDRSEDEPIIIAGGGMSNCCEPMAEFIDIFLLGEAEETIVKLAELLMEHKRRGSKKKDVLLETAAKFNCCYVPSLYKFEYDSDGIKSFQPIDETLPRRFENAVVQDFDNAPVPSAPIVPFVQAVHERISVEIMRGCPGRCRFCQASFCRRPVRYRSVDKIFEMAKAGYKSTGFDTVGLLSLSTADYPHLEELTKKLSDYFEPRHVGISLPSLRVDKQLQLLPKLVAFVRKGGLTIAVEAASARLRNIINKPISDEDLFAAVEAAYREGFSRLKIYFMVGFATETQEDIERIVDLCFDMAKLRKKISGQFAQINAAISWLVPKAHTPFAWLGQKPAEYFENAKTIILTRKRELRANCIRFKFHDINRSLLESAIGRAQRRMADVIEYAFRSGARFDLWDECFDYQLWEKAFAEFGFDIEKMAQKTFSKQELLPWEHLGGPQKKYLLEHLKDV
ncbi:MAG: TIGR03960 family B12-binding radical SAM protein [Planctomycetes bacterium]|nr:TIGR03960 family B12-binding radical SAM protein [Planctomycetota bacterium]